MKPIQLDQDQANNLLDRMGATPDKTIARLVKYLAMNPESTSEVVRASTNIDNISNIARNANAKLWPLGYYIICQRPLDPMTSNKYQWSLIEVKAPGWKSVDQALGVDAANDPQFKRDVPYVGKRS